MIRAPVPRVQVVESVSRGRLAWLFDRDGLREVPRLIDIRALEIGHVVGEELQRKYCEQRENLGLRRRYGDDVGDGGVVRPR